MTMHKANIDSPVTLSTGSGDLSFKAEGGRLEFCYRSSPPAVATFVTLLPAPATEVLEGGMLDPNLSRAFVRVAPYPHMKCGDKLILSWSGLDAEGVTHEHQICRYISEGRVGQEVVFVVKAAHIAPLEQGSVEIYWTLHSTGLPEPVSSSRLQLNVGDPEPFLPAPSVDETVGETLDPARVSEGTSVMVQPYARMARGDRVVLTLQNEAGEDAFLDELAVESFAVGQVLSFWITADCIAEHSGERVSISYRVESVDAKVRQSASVRLLLAPLIRVELAAPDVLEAPDGELEAADSVDGITVVIGNVQALEGELVYLRCDGEYFNHRDDRDITRENTGQPLVFIVPHRFWREHRETVVQVSYTVERLDDVSQASRVTRIRVRA
ncbi:hypothetical protein ACIOZM_03260 [Pseudomonas sp. NPDC087346]|uniref:hypothetical protein n=1 Tax=Pseudomonas sp. NPDC087346 TaxID=3364438 RepID=UPI00381F05C7